MQNDYEIGPGTILKVFSVEETAEIEKSWMNIFCKNKQGFNTKAYKWQIFSGGGYPSVDGDAAREEYKMQSAEKFVMLPNDGGNAVLTDCLPQACCLSDYYVFPLNMAWVMAFTHEEGWLGPYFAKHKNYNALNKDNLMQVKKAQQKAEAKKKGWI
ncbi:hypothetical protein MGA5115_02615 [Marinomonas gallaica]|uniref:DUF4275 family protein n=1 Tax=Marinomonas gallaica TaxID=1806667 RepID=A0A1C3JTC5_9GAMM|nr:DUF4275 family protein [Marinomonas gallaica]SBT18484.1 hypothetical protein MGA5115_02615 [Marinomonas gallaica]SBT22807.1 hypothetical protein MGA5116_03437 [Marinomonas gallaica]